MCVAIPWNVIEEEWISNLKGTVASYSHLGGTKAAFLGLFAGFYSQYENGNYIRMENQARTGKTRNGLLARHSCCPENGLKPWKL